MRRIGLLVIGTLLIGCALCSPAAAQTKFYQYYQKGLDYVEAGDALRALDQFESAASLAFEDKNRKRIYGTRFIEYFPHYQMAKIYADLGEVDNARRELELSLAFVDSREAVALRESLGGAKVVASTEPIVAPPPKPVPPEEPKITPPAVPKPVVEEKKPVVEEKKPAPVEPPKPKPKRKTGAAPVEKPKYDPTDVPRVGERLAMAVLPFTQEGGEGSLTSQATDGLINELVNLRRFTILDRNALDKLLDEQALGMSGVIDEKKAVEAGKMAGADAVVIGTLAVAPGYTKVQAKVIDTETSETLASRDCDTPESDPASLETEVARLAVLIYNDLPLVMGSVVQVEGNTVYLDLGADLNVRRGTKCIVYHEGEPVLHPKTGEVLGVRRELITEVIITDVQPKMSIATIIPETGEGQIAVGDKVVVK